MKTCRVAARRSRPGGRDWVAACAVALALAVAAAAGEPAEPSVRPGVNDKYLAPDLEVEEWTGRFETESREIYRERKAIVAALGLAPGMRVADVGAGTGLFVGPLSAGVGADGEVVAVEIAPRFLEHLRERSKKEGLDNVRVVEGGDHSIRVEPGTLDLVFLCDVYHHFEYPKAMLDDLRAALRPGGALVVIDFERIPGKTRQWILGHVRAGRETTVAEIEAAGFALEGQVGIAGLEENYLVRFRKPR